MHGLGRLNEVSEDEQSNVHDQLPTLQEIHSKSYGDLNKVVSYAEQVRRKRVMYTVAFLAGIIILTVIIIFGFGSEEPKNSVPDSSGSGDTRGKVLNDDEKIANREKSTLAFLSTLSSSSDLLEKGSSQERAANWIMSGDDLQLEIPTSLNDEGATKFVSRYAVAVLYFALDGSRWRDKYGFLNVTDECEWDGLISISTSESAPVGILCNEQLEPNAIVLPSNGLKGSIPTEIGLLTSLIHLELGGNEIKGSLPSQLQNLQSLKTFNFQINELRGTIPEWLGRLSNLEWLSLSGNTFMGSIPDAIGSLSNLKLLSLEGCKNINGTIPDTFQNLIRLERFYLSHNQLKGPIPSWIGDLTNLIDLGLSNNKLSSAIPMSLGTLESLVALFLDDNDLTGDLSVIESLNNLQYLLVEDNKFEQSLDSNFLASLDKLRILDASNNNLKGLLPPHLFDMKQLQVLDLHGNEIAGKLPDFPPSNDMLQFLSMYENNIDGSIPLSIVNLHSLTHLDLSSNSLTGPIPATLGDMNTLTYLFLAVNSFDSGTIPYYLEKLSNLKELSLKGTSRTGIIPDWIGNLQNLILLDIASNSFAETIPPQIGTLKNLNFLLLNHNELTGTVPATLHLLPQLKMLLIDDNNISGLGKASAGLGYTYDFCDAIPFLGTYGSVFTSDCGAQVPELECPCCTECCSDDAPCTEDNSFLANHDLIWENGYDRRAYVFSSKTVYLRTPV